MPGLQLSVVPDSGPCVPLRVSCPDECFSPSFPLFPAFTPVVLCLLCVNILKIFRMLDMRQELEAQRHVAVFSGHGGRHMQSIRIMGLGQRGQPGQGRGKIVVST